PGGEPSVVPSSGCGLVPEPREGESSVVGNVGRRGFSAPVVRPAPAPAPEPALSVEPAGCGGGQHEQDQQPGGSHGSGNVLIGSAAPLHLASYPGFPR